jgi:hypothetical protein
MLQEESMLLRLRYLLPALLAFLAVTGGAYAQAPGHDANDRPLDTAPVPAPAPVPGYPQGYAYGMPGEPIPAYRAPMGQGAFAQQPPLPNYAWPTFAPYNNYSRVGYPLTYPCDAFPNIGPFYPYPKAPLGWRHVKLSFDDGHWYLGSHAGPRDWWIVRYW